MLCVILKIGLFPRLPLPSFPGPSHVSEWREDGNDKIQPVSRYLRPRSSSDCKPLEVKRALTRDEAACEQLKKKKKKTGTLSGFSFLHNPKVNLKPTGHAECNNYAEMAFPCEGFPGPGLPSLHVNTLIDCSGVSV